MPFIHGTPSESIDVLEYTPRFLRQTSTGFFSIELTARVRDVEDRIARLCLFDARSSADRRLIETVHSTRNRPALVRLAQRSRQFLLRLQDAIVSRIDAPNVLRAARMQNRHAADRGVVRRGIAVARQLNPIVLLR